MSLITKKKAEEDEETRQQKQEERGVRRAFQRGECTRGDGCKFSHDEQRAANTGCGSQDRSSRWGHEKFEGNRDPGSRARGGESALEGHPKKSDEREEKRLMRRYDDMGKPRKDQNRREEKRSIRHDADEFETNSREDHNSREEKRLRRQMNDESEFGSGGQYRTEEKRLRRLGADDEFEPRSREDRYRREERRSARHECESYLREDRDRRGGNKLSTWHEDSSSYRYRERNDRLHKSDR